MKFHDDGTVTVDDDARDPVRTFSEEDLEHLRGAIREIQDESGAVALPGVEAVYHQIALRLEGGVTPASEITVKVDGSAVGRA